MQAITLLYAYDPVLTPERKLWRAVLERAYADAELTEMESDSALENSVLARQLLRADTPDEEAILARVCEFADVPADRVIAWARKRYPAAA